MLKRELVRGIVISNTCVKLYRNWIINEVARAGEHTNEHTYVLTYIRTGQTLYPLHNFVVRGDNNNKFVNSILVAEDGTKREGVVLQKDERRMEETLRHMRRYLNT